MADERRPKLAEIAGRRDDLLGSGRSIPAPILDDRDALLAAVQAVLTLDATTRDAMDRLSDGSEYDFGYRTALDDIRRAISEHIDLEEVQP